MAAIYRDQRAGGVAVFGAMSGIGAGDLTAAVAANGTVTYNGTAAVVASIVSGSLVTAAVAAVGSIIHTGTAAVVATITDPGPAPTLVAGKRRVRVGDVTAPAKLQRMDYQEADNIAFEHADQLLAGETIDSAAVTIEVHLGADDTPGLVLQYAPQISGTNVIQRVRGRVSGATYMLRSLATLNSGRVLVGAALLPIFKLR